MQLALTSATSTTHHQPSGPASSSWEVPITDSQAVAISDHILIEQENALFFSEDEESTGPDIGPAWEAEWYQGLRSDQYPADMQGYGNNSPDAYAAFWETWLEEVQRPPEPDYYYIQNDRIIDFLYALVVVYASQPPRTPQCRLRGWGS